MFRRCIQVVAVVLLAGVSPVGASPIGAASSPTIGAKPSPQCTTTHRVLPNDSWTRLSARFKIPQARLLRFNSASLATPLRVGDRICLAERKTSGGSLSTTTTTTVVTTTTTTTVVTTTTTTTVVTTTTTTPRGAVTAPVLAGAHPASCEPIQLSWSGANPDTGWYSVQWVTASTNNFNTYTMFNVRGTSVTLPNWFVGGTSYRFRVYAMRADWDGLWHRNENVTPQSNVIEIAVPTCIPTGGGNDAPTCAQGGTCVVGDTGPGGGIVFYVHDDADDLFTSTGSDCGSNCRYLEMAPSDFAGDHLWATAVNTCYVDADPNPITNTGASCQTGSVYRESDIPDQEASRTLSLAIGMGMTNSNLLVDRLTTAGGSNVTDYAAGMAVDYSNNGKSDWHLPSRDEMNELCKYARQQTTGDPTVPCDNTGSLRAGFQAWYYWTSSELIASGAPAGVEFGLHDGSAGVSYASKAFADKARAIRAFG